METCKKLWNVEVLECGVWNTWDDCETLELALIKASQLTLDVREEWIRIVDCDGKIL